jgi:hypothetical protein
LPEVSRLNLFMYLSYPLVSSACLSHLNILDFITGIIFNSEYR